MAMETQNRVVYEGETTRPEDHTEQIHREDSHAEMVARGGISLAMFAGLCTIVLAILGLASIVPVFMACIAAIVVGAGFLFEGGTSAPLRYNVRSRFNEMSEGGLSAQAIGGIASIVLGILALLGTNPVMLLSISVLALGASLFVGSWAGAFGSAKVFLGLSSLVLGVLCVMGYMPLTLSLIGYLCLGSAALLSGSRLIAPTRT
jgi:hypothetical protein